MNTRLASEQVVIESPMSFAGSAKRIWNVLGQPQENGWLQLGLSTLGILLIVGAWSIIISWYLMVGLLVVPFRIFSRGGRKRHRDDLRHRETLAALQSRQLPRR